jgi:fused signal recognition particle receptor
MEALVGLIQTLYSAAGLGTATSGDVFGLAAVVLFLVLSVLNFMAKAPVERQEKIEELTVKPTFETKLEAPEVKTETPAPAPEPVQAEPVQAEPVQAEPIKEEGLNWTERLKKGLGQSREKVWGRLGSIFNGKALDEDSLEELEELLYGADIGPKATAELIDAVEEKAKSGDFTADDFKKYLFSFLHEKMNPIQSHVNPDLYRFDPAKKGQTQVIMVVGVNGAGKTTTIGKLATKLTRQGAKVVVGACDTFRAAAVDQLQVWCDRAGATMIRAKEGANPSGVGYEAYQTALNEKADYCILDTAGRLHTKGNLMDELQKSKNVLKKLDETAPHQTLLVIDAITGQNAVRQAEEFHKTLELNGLIFTKCDGSSKAGSAVAIVQQLNVPISYIGVGEGVEDLDVFNLDQYLGALLDVNTQALN